MGPVGGGRTARATGLAVGVAPLGAPFGLGSPHPYPVAGRGGGTLTLGAGVTAAPEEATAGADEPAGACAAAIGAADKTRTVKTTERQERCARMQQVKHAPAPEGNSPTNARCRQKVVLKATRIAPFDGVSKIETAPASGRIPATSNTADGVTWRRTSGSATRRGSVMPVFWVMGTLP